ncbi:MAG: Ig-like domain-containing protein [Candidatus Dojkabacteria bacterium]
MLTSIINTIGIEKFIFVILVAIPFVFVILTDLILVRKNVKDLKIKTFLKDNRFILLAIFLSTIILGAIVLIIGYYDVTPQIIFSSPATGENWSNYDKPIEVDFNVPVQISSLEPRMTPKLEGDWVWEKFLFSNYTVRGHFYPKQTYLPDQRIVIYIIGVKRLFVNSENHELALNFFSPKAPEVLNTTPADQEGSFNREDSIKVLLTKNNYYLSTWTYSIQPSVALDVESQFSSVLEFKPQAPLDADTQYKLTISRHPIQYDISTSQVISQQTEPDFNYSISFKTLKEPFIETLTPQGTGIRDDSSLSVKFTLPMKRESVESHFSTEPKIIGTFNWTDDNSFVFTPTTKLAKGTKFQILFSKGIESLDQGPTYKDLIYSFETVGAIKLTGSVPTNGSNNVGENTVIRIGLDQDVDHASAQANLTVTPDVPGTFTWDNRDLVLTPNNPLGFNQTYTAVMHKGVKSVYGIDSTEDFSVSFKVRAQEVVISGIPQIYQPYGSFSCNLYAGIMALSWKGYNLSAAGVISETGYNPNQSNGTWSGNPYKEYVGNSDGSWGYGIYWTALQKPFNNRGITTEIKEGWNKYSLAATIINGNPVVIWRYNGESSNYDKNWTASDGTYIHGINGQHGGLVIGVRGPTTNPEAFLVNDPWYGQTWFSADYLDYTWSRMNRTAMIIY